MWNPFLKKPLSADKLPVADKWQVARGQRAGKPMILRTHEGYRDFRGVSGFDHQVGIAVSLHDADANGLPTANESQELDALENAICNLFESESESLFVATVTCDGFREFVLYTRNPDAVRRKFKALENRMPTHKVFLKMQPDEEWSVYSRLV
jgi:hypothetical protein